MFAKSKQSKIDSVMSLVPALPQGATPEFVPVKNSDILEAFRRIDPHLHWSAIHAATNKKQTASVFVIEPGEGSLYSIWIRNANNRRHTTRTWILVKGMMVLSPTTDLLRWAHRGSLSSEKIVGQTLSVFNRLHGTDLTRSYANWMKKGMNFEQINEACRLMAKKGCLTWTRAGRVLDHYNPRTETTRGEFYSRIFNEIVATKPMTAPDRVEAATRILTGAVVMEAPMSLSIEETVPVDTESVDTGSHAGGE